MAMKILADFAAWWRPKPLWFKIMLVAVAWPAWAVGLLCAQTGRADSPVANVAWVIFGLCAVIAAIFESRNRKSGPHESIGGDVCDGGD